MTLFFQVLGAILATYWPVPVTLALLGGLAVRNHLNDKRESLAKAASTNKGIN
jgi:hypothetical protein